MLFIVVKICCVGVVGHKTFGRKTKPKLKSVSGRYKMGGEFVEIVNVRVETTIKTTQGGVAKEDAFSER